MRMTMTVTQSNAKCQSNRDIIFLDCESQHHITTFTFHIIRCCDVKESSSANLTSQNGKSEKQ